MLLFIWQQIPQRPNLSDTYIFVICGCPKTTGDMFLHRHDDNTFLVTNFGQIQVGRFRGCKHKRNVCRWSLNIGIMLIIHIWAVVRVCWSLYVIFVISCFNFCCSLSLILHLFTLLYSHVCRLSPPPYSHILNVIYLANKCNFFNQIIDSVFFFQISRAMQQPLLLSTAEVHSGVHVTLVGNHCYVFILTRADPPNLE